MKTNNHWTGDEELREQFVLHHLDEETTRSLEAHLASCPQCREAIEQELRIAATVRRAGRDALKQRIAARADGITKTPWPKIISAAALIAIVIGIGSYYRWFEGREQTIVTTKSDQDLAKNRVGNDEKSMADTVKSPSVTFADQAEVSQESGAAKGGEKLTVAKELPASRPSLEGALQENARRDKGQGYSMPMAQAEQRVAYWIDGILVGGENEMGKLKTSATDEVTRLRSRESFAVPPLQEKDARLEKKAEEAPPSLPQQYNVMQMPLADLPQTQQYRQQKLATNTVQTEIERNDGTVNITLFTDQQFDPEDIAHATVQQIGNDSLVVQLRRQMIGYRLPAGWNTK